jgi:hypothetical protein
MATLRHPNIVDVKTVMEDDQRILIVMENLTGGELFDYISNKGSLDEREARRIFHQIVLAIHYCHEVLLATNCGPCRQTCNRTAHFETYQQAQYHNNSPNAPPS